jgi:hypothetical protein
VCWRVVALGDGSDPIDMGADSDENQMGSLSDSNKVTAADIGPQRVGHSRPQNRNGVPFPSFGETASPGWMHMG